MTGIITVPFHIGDFLSGTMHMDTLEKGAYLMLMLAHYQAGEKGIPADDKKLANIAGVTLKKWQLIKPVLAEKFETVDGFWRSKKCIEVLQKVFDHSASQRAKALKRHGSPPATAEPQQCQPKPKPKPVVSKNKSGAVAQSFPKPPDVSERVWADHLAARKAKRQPITETALTQMRQEAESLGWSLERALTEACSRGWASFKAEWINTNEGNGNAKFGSNQQKPNGKSQQVRDILADELEKSFRRDGQEGFGSPRIPSV